VKGSSSWLAIRKPLSPRWSTAAKIGAFLIPLALWCAASYLPFLWPEDVRVTNPGDSIWNRGQVVSPEAFELHNAQLQKQKKELDDGTLAPKQPAVGEPVPRIPNWLPAPHAVARAFVAAYTTPPAFPNEPWLYQSLWHSCQIIFWGFLYSAILGIPLGILCGTFDLFSKLTEPFIDFIRYMPAPVFGVVCIALLGLHDAPKIAIIWIGTFFQMVLVVANTTRQFDVSLLEAAQTLGASRRSLVTKVILPGILPNLYNDMRILIGWAWTYLIVAELIGASSGISYFINQQGMRFRNFEYAYVGIISIGLVGLLFDQFLATLAPFLFPWMPRTKGSGAWAAFFSAVTFLPRWAAGRVSVVPRPQPPATTPK
jgi:NitT/TauT family transport system permease protein